MKESGDNCLTCRHPDGIPPEHLDLMRANAARPDVRARFAANMATEGTGFFRQATPVMLPPEQTSAMLPNGPAVVGLFAPGQRPAFNLPSRNENGATFLRLHGPESLPNVGRPQYLWQMRHPTKNIRDPATRAALKGQPLTESIFQIRNNDAAGENKKEDPGNPKSGSAEAEFKSRDYIRTDKADWGYSLPSGDLTDEAKEATDPKYYAFTQLWKELPDPPAKTKISCPTSKWLRFRLDVHWWVTDSLGRASSFDDALKLGDGSIAGNPADEAQLNSDALKLKCASFLQSTVDLTCQDPCKMKVLDVSPRRYRVLVGISVTEEKLNGTSEYVVTRNELHELQCGVLVVCELP
ncbi:MAG: hypothetical protein HS108_00835 [Planctomycetes bacterium]|jgi:hypothetical protein|nr:hypothetical protein [Planctomycetota bacterium]MCL4729121.1 hypothetical protein [Planctomycetota bacterium]